MYFCFFAALTTIFLTVAFTFISLTTPYNRKRLLSTRLVIIIGISLASVLLFIPLYNVEILGGGEKNHISDYFLSILLSIHNTIRLFAIDGEFGIIINNLTDAPAWLEITYRFLMAVLFISAPVMTFTVVISFFANAKAYLKYWFGFKKDAYVFSELNDRSITLAKDIRKNHPSSLIVFTDVYKKKEDELSHELIESAKETDSVLFKNDITVVNFSFHSDKALLYFFVIGENEEENINHTIAISAPSLRHTERFTKSKNKTELLAKLLGDNEKEKLLSFRERIEKTIVNGESADGYDYPSFYKATVTDSGTKEKKTVLLHSDRRIYVFSGNPCFEYQLRTIETSYIRIRRINDAQSLIYRYLYDNGTEIFDKALPTGKTVTAAHGISAKEKQISIVIVGMGAQGIEAVKGFIWFCQMFGYRLRISVFDCKDDIEKRFESVCPELISKKNNLDVEGESHYELEFFGGYDVLSADFDAKISELTDTTLVVVSLGKDDINIRTAIKIRSLLGRCGVTPVVRAIVYNPDKKKLIIGSGGEFSLNYSIETIGDLPSNYSEGCIISSEIERKGLERHSLWDSNEESFWKNEYNYRSSIASAIHYKYKLYCGLPGIEKRPDDRSEGERQICRITEHQRWNAFVRSEGYVEGSSKNHVIKTHPLLVKFDDLPEKERKKDDD